MQLTRIDEVVSTSTMMSGQTIGFLYTTADGGTWLGQRTNTYMSAGNATAINAVLASTQWHGRREQRISAAEPLWQADGVPAIL